MRILPFSDVITDATSKFRKIKASDYKIEGLYKIIDQGQKAVAGFTDDEALINRTHAPIIIFGDHTRVFKYEVSPIALGADGAKALWVDPAIADTLYIYHYLRTINLKGAGYSRHFKFLKQVEIPIPERNGKPDLDDQRRIAHLLGKVEGLIARRKHHLQQLDDLLKSIFLEMFGDPVRNEKGWEPVMLGEIFKVASGTGLVTKEMDSDGSYNVYGGNGVNGTHSEYLFEKPTLVIGRVGYYCGSIHITEPKSWVTDNALYIKEYFQDVNIFYLKNLLEIIDLNKYAGRAAQPLVSGSRIYPIKTIDVPIVFQNQFAAIVEKVERLKVRYQQSLADLERLYGGLSQEAFKGELDLARVVLPVESAGETGESREDPSRDPREQAGLNFKLSPPPAEWSETETKRHAQTRNWFAAYLDQLPSDASPSLETFFALVDETIYESESESAATSVADYDQVQRWLYQAIEDGRLVQTRNPIELDGNPDLGNQVILKKV